MCTPKKDGGTRICVDMSAANQAIHRERHVMSTLADFKAEMNGSKYFSKIDLKQAYHQLELTEESRYITTFLPMKVYFVTNDLFHFISFHFIWSLITHFRINNELQCVYIQSEIQLIVIYMVTNFKVK